MIKRFFLCSIIFVYSLLIFAQKPSLDTSDLGKWPYVENPGLSRDGQYATYTIKRQPLGNHTLIVHNTKSNEEHRFIGGDDAFFSGDNRCFIFRRRDSLFFFTLDSAILTSVSKVISYKHPNSGAGEWLAYQLGDSLRTLVLKNLITGKEETFSSVTTYIFDHTGHTLVVETNSKQNGGSTQVLTWRNLSNGSSSIIWTDKTESPGKLTVGALTLDASGDQLAFSMTEKTTTKFNTSIWYYKSGMEKAMKWVDNQIVGMNPTLTINKYSIEFNQNGRWICFQLDESITKEKPEQGAVKVDIWRYNDIELQPDQMRHLKIGPKTYWAVVSTVRNQNAYRLEYENEGIITLPPEIRADYAVVASNTFSDHFAESWQPKDLQPVYYLVSLHDGSRRLLGRGKQNLYNFSFSPLGRYLVYYNSDQEHFYSYDIQTGKVRNITTSIGAKVSSDYVDGSIHKPVSGVAGWQVHDSALLLQDNYDIWQVDPSGRLPPSNLTAGYGLSHQLKLRLVDLPDDREDPIIFRGDESLLLSAFSPMTKYNGFFRMKLGVKKPPELLTLGPYTYFRPYSQYYNFGFVPDVGMGPIKAETSGTWLVWRESATEAPNYYITRDLRTYKPISTLAPQEKVNWLTAELITWKQLDGTFSQGILYKPENFDTKKKYPVLFNYYERLSYSLYQFNYPEYTEANINIPWFVSLGYLVFLPDIQYSLNHRPVQGVGKCVYNSVVSAARYLSHLPYVDSRKMGIQGHSFGGFETNYLVTHTNIFAAAAEAAGVTDPISAYLTLLPWPANDSIENESRQTGMETRHEQYKGTPWDIPEIYAENSAVLHADRVSTPLLIMHNRRDNQIQWRQGIEFYMALRRLGKPVWMLQYDKGYHDVTGKEAEDFTYRLGQFFNYYLKDQPPPQWMTVGVPAGLKGIKTGFELDLRAGVKP